MEMSGWEHPESEVSRILRTWLDEGWIELVVHVDRDGVKDQRWFARATENGDYRTLPEADARDALALETGWEKARFDGVMLRVSAKGGQQDPLEWYSVVGAE
jgi:hypothetical protein